MILLRNCKYIATQDKENRELTGWDILIDGNVISRIDKDIQVPENAEVIDASAHTVIPGLVNTHHHLYQTLTRNLPGAQNAKLFDWLVYLYPIWARIDAEAVYLSSLMGITELMLTGCTTTTDHHYLYPRGFDGDLMGIQFDAAEKAGIRFAPTRGSMTRSEKDGGLPPDHVVQSVDEVLEDMKRVVAKYHDPSPLSMRRIIFAPCSPFSVEEQVMRKTADLARELGVFLHTHLAETEDENDFCIETHNMRPLAVMQEWGWTGRDVFFAHGVHFDDSELAILKETGTGVAHCPNSNMRLGSGIARIKEMKDMGIRVGIAVDGSASNDASDMLGELRQAMLLQRVKYGADALTARDVFRMGTLGSADLLGYDSIGSIEVGKAADIAMFRTDALQYAGTQSDPLAALVFTGFDHRADHVIVNGKVRVRSGQPTFIDEMELFDRFQAKATQILK